MDARDKRLLDAMVKQGRAFREQQEGGELLTLGRLMMMHVDIEALRIVVCEHLRLTDAQWQAYQERAAGELAGLYPGLLDIMRARRGDG